MPRLLPRRLLVTVCSFLALAWPTTARAQDRDAQRVPQGRVHIPLALVVGQPVGEFADYVKNAAFGFSGGAIWKLGESPVALRGDLGFLVYGSRTRRERLGGGALGLIQVDVRTTNNIFDAAVGLQVGTPGTRWAPYVGGGIGFANLFTESSVSGRQNTTAEPFASSVNLSDAVFQPVLFGGLYLPFGGGRGTVDLGVRWHNSGEARYLTRDGITFDSRGEPVLSPVRSAAPYLGYRLGVTLNAF